MAFFDEDEPTQASGGRRLDPPVSDSDRQTLLVRRGIAALIGLIFVIVVVIGIKGCLDNRKQSSLKAYNSDVAALMQESDDQVAKPFFQLLSGGQAKSPFALETDVNQLRVNATELVKRAERIKVPDQMTAAQRNFLLVLEERRDALAKIAKKIPTALAQQGSEEAIKSISAQMLSFLASDVIYAQRVQPQIKEALDSNGVGGQQILPHHSLPDLSWLNPQTVATRLGSSVKGATGGPAKPGLHGFSLTSVSAGDVALTPDSPNRIPATPGLAFTVKFQNQGENDETDVKVKLTVKGSGKPTTVTRTVDEVKQGTEGVATIPLSTTPTIGTPVTITAEVVPVAGEKKADNNKQSYPAIFTK